jgi:hypothetical protein
MIFLGGKFDLTGLRDTKKTIILIEGMLQQTRGVLLSVKKALADATHKLNPSTDPMKIYSKLYSAQTNMNDTANFLKNLEG